MLLHELVKCVLKEFENEREVSMQHGEIAKLFTNESCRSSLLYMHALSPQTAAVRQPSWGLLLMHQPVLFKDMCCTVILSDGAIISQWASEPETGPVLACAAAGHVFALLLQDWVQMLT